MRMGLLSHTNVSENSSNYPAIRRDLLCDFTLSQSIRRLYHALHVLIWNPRVASVLMPFLRELHKVNGQWESMSLSLYIRMFHLKKSFSGF